MVQVHHLLDPEMIESLLQFSRLILVFCVSEDLYLEYEGQIYYTKKLSEVVSADLEEHFYLVIQVYTTNTYNL